MFYLMEKIEKHTEIDTMQTYAPHTGLFLYKIVQERNGIEHNNVWIIKMSIPLRFSYAQCYFISFERQLSYFCHTMGAMY